MTDPDGPYRFDRLPINPIEPGTTLMVAGPSLGGLRDLLLGLLVGADHEGTLIVAADVNASRALDHLESAGGPVDTERVRVIDCAHDDTQHGDHVRGVNSPADLTGIGMAFSSFYEGLYADGYQRVRSGMYTLAPLLLYVDDVRAVFRFLHTVTGRIRAVDGFGACAVDPGSHDDRTINSLAQAFDGRIELKAVDEGCKIRVQGLANQPDGWREFDAMAANR